MPPCPSQSVIKYGTQAEFRPPLFQLLTLVRREQLHLGQPSGQTIVAHTHCRQRVKASGRPQLLARQINLILSHQATHQGGSYERRLLSVAHAFPIRSLSGLEVKAKRPV